MSIRFRLAMAFMLPVALVASLPGCGRSRPHVSRGGYYLALGDSLAAGYQAPHIPTDRRCIHPGADRTGSRGYVCLLLEKLRGVYPSIHLQSLGLASVPGEDSCAFRFHISCSGFTLSRDIGPGDVLPYPMQRESQLAAALAFLRRHRGHVRVVTLQMGGDDFGPLIIQAVSGGLAGARAALPRTLARLARNYTASVAALRSAAPQARLVLIDQYDPLSGVPAIALGPDGGQILALSERTLRGFSGLVRNVAARYHAVFANVQRPFHGRALSLTRIANANNVHPNAAGYRIYARAVWESLRIRM